MTSKSRQRLSGAAGLLALRVRQPEHGTLVQLLAPHDESVRAALAAHRQAVEKAQTAIDDAEDARAALERAPLDAERAGVAAARSGQPGPPKQPDLAQLSAEAGFTRQRASDLAKRTRQTAQALDQAAIKALPHHLDNLLDASEAVEAWQVARRQYEQAAGEALGRAGAARHAAGVLLAEYGGEAGTAAARDVLPPVRGEDDLPAYSTKIDVLALLDRRAAPHRGYYGSKAMVDDVGRTASLAADALRANLGAERQEAI